jgi:hypothetical protein
MITSHHSCITDFIRDPRSGGCAVGIPLPNLGFRSVRAGTMHNAGMTVFQSVQSATRKI